MEDTTDVDNTTNWIPSIKDAIFPTADLENSSTWIPIYPTADLENSTTWIPINPTADLENSTTWIPSIKDQIFPNGSDIFTNWTSFPRGCTEWKLPNHPLFQIANAVLLLALLSPQWKHGVLFLHATFAVGFLLLSLWAWIILCAADYFTWNFALTVLNVIHTLMIIYRVKPVKFDEGLEKLYLRVFQPMNVSRQQFKKLVDGNFCMISALHEGDAYAVQGITKTDRLGLLISGTMKVYSHQNLLHLIHETEFIDSPEFESSVTGDEKFQVSIYAGSDCKYVYWPRQSLEYLLMKEPFLASVLNTIMGRDITNKLYALNSRVKEPDTADSPEDNNVPSFVELKPKRKVFDLRRTLAQVSSQVFTCNQPAPLVNVNTYMVEEENELDEIEGPYSVAEEEVDLIDHRSNQMDLVREDSPAKCSMQSYQSGIHFNVAPN